MAELLRIARGSVSEASAAALAAAGGFTIEWYEEILRDGILVQEVIAQPMREVDDSPDYPEFPAEDYDDEGYDDEPEPTSDLDNVLRVIRDAEEARRFADSTAAAMTAALEAGINISDVTAGPSNVVLDSAGAMINPCVESPALVATGTPCELALEPPKAKRGRPAKKLVDIPTPIVENKVPTIYNEYLKQNAIKTINLRIDKTQCSGYSVVVFGCGGTGGRLIELLAQTVMSDAKANPGKSYNMFVVDPDTIETKNLSRQAFYEFELGMNKAEAIATRCNLLYGTQINFLTHKIDETNYTVTQGALLNAAGQGSSRDPFIVFDCTDNIDARKAIEVLVRSINKHYVKNFFLISCGNEFDFGQVILSNQFQHTRNYAITNAMDEELPIIRDLTLFYKTINFLCPNRHHTDNTYAPTLPSLFSLYKEFKDTETSCAEIAAIREQSMPINSLVANIGFSVFNQIVSGYPVKNNLTTCNTSNTEFSNWNISIPDNYMKVMVRAIYGNKLMPDEIAEAKEYLAETAKLMYGYKNIERYPNSIGQFFDYAFLQSYIVFIGSQNEDKKTTLYDCLKHYLTNICTSWVYYPLVLNLLALYKHLYRDENHIPNRDRYVAGASAGMYSSDQIYGNFIYNNSTQKMWNAMGAGQDKIQIAFAAFKPEEKAEIDNLFKGYFETIKGKVQVTNAIV